MSLRTQRRRAPSCHRLAAMLAGALAACTSAPGDVPVLVRTDPATPEQCPLGGKVASSGLDLDRDGALQDGEVTVRTLVCDRAPSGIALRQRDEPAGPHCASGGTAVQSGLDLDGDGRLGDAEVVRTDYVCSVAVLMRIVSEPPGTRCSDGGVAFLTGSDRDGDGALSDAEIEHTDLTCGDVVSRDVAIGSAAEAAALAQVRVITGSVTIQLAALDALSLPRLERIGGSLQVIGNARLARLDLPVLQAIDGDVTLRASPLTAVDCPLLRRTGSLDLELLSLTSLTGLPALTEVEGDVRIAHMPLLTSISLPIAASVGNLSITENTALAHVAWDVTDRLGDVAIRDNRQLATVDLSMRVLAGGTVRAGTVDVTSNPMLGRLALRARQIASFTIGAEPLITDLQLLVSDIEGDATIVDISSPFSLAMRGRFGSMDIGGDLRIAGPATEFEPGDGIRVRGRFVLEGTRLTTLARFEGSLDVLQALRVSNNNRLTDLSAFALIGDLEVTGNSALSSVNLEHLLGDELGAITIKDNPKLVSAPTLTFLSRVHGAVDIERNPKLTALFGPALSRIEGAVRVRDNASLAELSFPGLAFVGSPFELISNAALQVAALPALPEAGALTIAGHPQLHHVDFAALTHSDDLRVDDNPHLPTCEVLGMFAHVTGAQEQSGNDDEASCDEP